MAALESFRSKPLAALDVFPVSCLEAVLEEKSAALAFPGRP
jgi:hypothetical protein